MKELIANSKFVKVPSVNFRNAAGKSFTGKKLSEGREIKAKKGYALFVYPFAAEDGDAPIQLNQDGTYVDVDINKGDTVEVFASKTLHEKLKLAKVNDTVKILYAGKAVGSKGGEFNDFKVFVL